MRRIISTRVRIRYAKYRNSAFFLALGTTLSRPTPGISARMMLEVLPGILLKMATTKTRIPMPPIQLVKLRQKIILWSRPSISSKIVAPVVVKPLTVSKKASTTLVVVPLNKKGSIPIKEMESQPKKTIAKPSIV